MTLARFQIEPTAAKPTISSKTVLTNLTILLIAFLPALKDFLESMGMTEVSIYIVQALAFLNIVLRFLTSGPVAGAGAAVGFGLKYTGKKIGDGVVSGTKGLVNVIPGVNIK